MLCEDRHIRHQKKPGARSQELGAVPSPLAHGTAYKSIWMNVPCGVIECDRIYYEATHGVESLYVGCNCDHCVYHFLRVQCFSGGKKPISFQYGSYFIFASICWGFPVHWPVFC